MHAGDFFVARIARRQGCGEYAARPETRLNGLDALGTLGMRYAAQMIPVKGIDDELQPECLAEVDPHLSDAAFSTCE